MRFLKKMFCPHLIWIKTGKMMGKLFEHKCNVCFKRIYREMGDEPISFIN